MRLVLEKPIKSWVQVTQACNLKCKQCYGDCGPEQRPEELTLTEYDALIREMSSEGVIDILVEGGEPLARPDLIPLLARFSPHVMTRLRTNATLLDKRTAQALKDAGVGGIFVDIMGATAEVNDWHVGVPGSFDKSVQGIKNALEAGFQTVMLMIMTRQNAGQAQAFVDLAHELGVKRIGILRLYPLGRARKHWREMSFPLTEQMATLSSIVLPEDMYLMTSWHPKDGNCCWQNAGVDATGRVTGCPYLRDYTDYGNVREVTWMESWNHPLYQQIRGGKVDESCPECRRTQGSRGGCRSTAYAFSGSWTAPDPFCTHMNRGTDVSELPGRLEELRIQPRPTDRERSRLLQG